MSATAKKPPQANGAAGRLSNAADIHRPGTPPRQRTATSTSANSGTNGSTPARTRSVRSGTPVSARAAASHRASSSLSQSVDPDSDARAEAVALIEDLKERLAKADASGEQYRKQAEVLQSRLDETLKEQAKLEERVHESEEQIETLKNEKRESARQIREMETIYEGERSSMLKEKEEMSNREEEMQAVINRLKETLNQKNAEEDRPTRQSTATSPTVDNGSFAPPSSVQRSDSRNNSKLLLQKDKLIESLRLELAEAQIKLVESENQGGGRLHEVERLLMEARMANARLMEDNESYQLLLQEKTLHGDFGKGDFSYMGVSANQDALNALEGRAASSTRPNSGVTQVAPGTSLADELGSVGDDNAESEEQLRRMESELKAAKDQNKALTLYINKIIERLLQHQEFEHILDQSGDSKPSGEARKEKELPAPPPAENSGFFQRAKSMASGTNSNRPKPRPMTMHFTAQQQPSAHSNPDTAPRIPIALGRSASMARRGRPMSEQFVGAAGVVNAMYRGPDGPLSPSFSNPRTSSLFSSPRSPRISSAASTPTTNGPSGTAGNFPGSVRSETSSVSGDSADHMTPGTPSTSASITQSPPRAPSHMEKNTTIAGNKPRPLRLVQETAEAAAKENKRQSWMPWSPWGKKDESTTA